MAYKPNIPQSTDTLDTSQADILGNFQAISTLIGVNHGNFGTSVEGKHTFIEFPVQAVDPATLPQEVALFCKNGPTSGVPELAFKRENNGTVAVFTEGAAAGNSGYTRLPSGALIKFALYNITSAAGGVFFRPTALAVGPVNPVFTEIDAVFVTAATSLTTDQPTAIPYFVSVGTTGTTVNIVNNSTKSGGGWNAYQVSLLIIGKG